MNEGDAVALFEALAGRIGQRGVSLGIGDDAALLQGPADDELVVCIDTLNLGTHFTDEQPAASVGHRALAVNLSDLAAMGGQARWVLLSVSMPEPDEAWLRGLAAGFERLAGTHGVALVGGDTTRGPRSVTVTALGSVPSGAALRRGTAMAGDRIWVTGTVGDAALALAEPAAGTLDRLLYPEPRLALGAALRGIASACIDLSDGLAADLPRLAGALGAEVQAGRLPLSPVLAARADGWRIALAGGDDYELCFCAPPARDGAVRAAADAAGTPVTAIGELCTGPACSVVGSDGQRQALAAFRGFEHFP